MTIKSLYPTVRPTLNLNFARTKVLDPRITFTRASTATFVGADGLIKTAASGAARFDHNPTTGESLGLLVEEARTNQILDSGTIVRGGTITDALTITTSSTTAPNGVLASADLITPTTSNTYHQTYSAYNYTGTTVTLSVFVKPNGYSKVAINAGPTGLTYFDLSGNGSLLYKDNTAIGHSVEKLSNGWFRISTTNASSPGSYRYQILVLDPAYTTGIPGPFAGDGTSGMYVWGLQLETGSFPTSYIPTTTATVTRAADIASITGTNFSSWYRQDEGTLYFKSSGSGYSAGAYLQGSGSSERVLLAKDIAPPNKVLYQITIGGATIFSNQLSASNLAFVNQPTQYAAAIKAAFYALACQGQIGPTNSNATAPPSMVKLEIGRDTAFNYYLNGTIARLAYYPVRLPNAQLQGLTQ